MSRAPPSVIFPNCARRGDGKLENISASSKTEDFKLFLIKGYKKASLADKAILFLENDFIAHAVLVKIASGNGFELHISKCQALYVNNTCTPQATEPRFYLHAVPVDPEKVNSPGRTSSTSI